MRKISLVHVFFILWGLMALLGVIYSLHAQDTPMVNTWFEQGCIEAMDETHYRIHFHYLSDGVETFTFSMGDVIGSNSETLPYEGHATTNVPSTFTTEVGPYDGWYLDAHSEDSPYTFHLLFQNDVGVADLPLNTWDWQEWCEAGQYDWQHTPQATITPPPTQNAGNGQVEPFPTMPIIMSTGVTCIVKYPQIVIVCNRGE